MDDWETINQYTLYSASSSAVGQMQKDMAAMRARGAEMKIKIASFNIESVGQGSAKVRMDMEFVLSTPTEYIRSAQSSMMNFKRVGGVWKQGEGTPIGEMRVLEHRQR